MLLYSIYSITKQIFLFIFSKISYNNRIRGRQAAYSLLLEVTHLWDRLNGLGLCHRCVNTRERRIGSVGILDIASRVVSIFAGIVGGLNGLVSLVQKCKPYIERRKAQTEKDPSASLAAPDGSDEDCLSNQ